MTLARLRDGAGSAAMAGFGLIALYRFREHGLLLYLLLALRDFWGAGLFLLRKPATRTSGRGVEMLAFVSAGLPLTYLSQQGVLFSSMRSVVDLFAIGGYLLSTLALVELGKSFGVAPAARGDRVKSGVYRVLSHPMYVGHLLAETGMVYVNPLNGVILFLSAGLYWVRAKHEEKIFGLNPKVV